MADLAQRRRHPASRILDGIDLLLDRHGGSALSDERMVRAILDHLRAVAAAKGVTRTRAARQAALQLEQVLGPASDRAAAIDAMARSLGVVENRRCLVVDDSARNLAELRRRGYRTVGVSGLISDRALPADLVVRDLVELGELLDSDRSRG